MNQLTTTRQTDARNLHQRLAAIAGDLVAIKPTGTTGPQAGNRPALSIADVEDALRPLFARYGVVSGYTWMGPPVVVKTHTTERGGTSEVYQVDLILWVCNADDPADRIEARVIDFGTTPSGAVSFALKRYYRALFHLADEEDDKPGPGVSAGRPTSPQPSQRPRAARPPQPAVGEVPAGGGSEAGTASGPAQPDPSRTSPQESRKDALGWLNRAFVGSGLSRDNLRDKAREMFGPHVTSVEDLTDSQISALADEVEALIQSTARVASP